VKLLVLLSEI